MLQSSIDLAQTAQPGNNSVCAFVTVRDTFHMTHNHLIRRSKITAHSRREVFEGFISVGESPPQ